MRDVKKEYQIVGAREVTDVDGKKWLEFLTDCGTEIGVANLYPDSFEVIVKGPEEDRSYCGGKGSEAHGTYTRFADAFERYFRKSQALGS